MVQNIPTLFYVIERSLKGSKIVHFTPILQKRIAKKPQRRDTTTEARQALARQGPLARLGPTSHQLTPTIQNRMVLRATSAGTQMEWLGVFGVTPRILVQGGSIVMSHSVQFPVETWLKRVLATMELQAAQFRTRATSTLRKLRSLAPNTAGRMTTAASGLSSQATRTAFSLWMDRAERRTGTESRDRGLVTKYWHPSIQQEI